MNFIYASVEAGSNTEISSATFCPVCPTQKREGWDFEEADGILKRVDHSDWGAHIVVVPKSNGSIPICSDYKVTVNQNLIVDQYPLPLPEDIFATLEGGALFTKLDLGKSWKQS